MAKEPHWHYKVEKSGPCRCFSKVAESGLTLSTFAEAFPYPDAHADSEEIVRDANAWRDHQWSLTHYHDVEEFYSDVKEGAALPGHPAER